VSAWEYGGFTFKPKAGIFAAGALDESKLFADLNKWGEKGWELVGFLPIAISGGLTNDVAVVFKRAKS
jgi:hypothetical protein